MKGVGDIIEALIPDAVKPKDCKGCAERKERLNKMLPLPKLNVRILRRRTRKTK
jgi:hypothetical protein